MNVLCLQQAFLQTSQVWQKSGDAEFFFQMMTLKCFILITFNFYNLFWTK